MRTNSEMAPPRGMPQSETAMQSKMLTSVSSARPPALSACHEALAQLEGLSRGAAVVGWHAAVEGLADMYILRVAVEQDGATTRYALRIPATGKCDALEAQQRARLDFEETLVSGRLRTMKSRSGGLYVSTAQK